jgi:Ca2+/Na+ antiporter
MNGTLVAYIPISLLIIILIFRFVSFTVEEYVTEGMVYISEYFKFPNALAAVTLLAISNGAGDVI